MKRRALVLMALVVAGGLFELLRPLFGCAPMFPEAVFTRARNPDFPLEKFVAGELAILQPTYTPSFLYVAYRHLSGIGFDQKEQQAVLEYWEEQMNRHHDPGPQPAVDRWLAARGKARAAARAGEIKPFRFLEKSYSEYLNCPGDAFDTAARTLAQRIEKFGGGSPEVRDWLQAQDAVFANCAGPQVIPAAASPQMHPLIRADRAYQVAAARFYAGNWDDAERMFRQISEDPASPWARLAPYLAARALVRKATLGAAPFKTDSTALAQAEERIVKLLADPRSAEVRGAARRLLNIVRFRLRPEERLQELAQAVLARNAGVTLKQDLLDYRLLQDRHVCPAIRTTCRTGSPHSAAQAQPHSIIAFANGARNLRPPGW